MRHPSGKCLLKIQNIIFSCETLDQIKVCGIWLMGLKLRAKMREELLFQLARQKFRLAEEDKVPHL